VRRRRSRSRSSESASIVSCWRRGGSNPNSRVAPASAVNLEKLAKALGVGPGDLLPGGGVERAMERDDPALELKAARGEPGKMWVRVNQALPAEIAVQVVSLIASANANKH
jgi:transcriptional regulator with XRE-family HTH domain